MFGDCTMFNDCQQHCSNTGVSVKPESGKKQGPGPTNCRLAAGNPSGCRHVELAQDSLPCVKGLLLIPELPHGHDVAVQGNLQTQARAQWMQVVGAALSISNKQLR